MLDIPRLLIPYGSSTAFIRFADDIVMVSMDEASPYEDTITLKDTGRNAFLGVGCVSTAEPSKRKGGVQLMLMPALGGLMGVEVFTPPSALLQ